MVVFCGVARKVRRFLAPCASNTRRDRRVDFERLKGGWRYHPAGALGKNTRQFFSIRMTDEQRYPPNRTLIKTKQKIREVEQCRRSLHERERGTQSVLGFRFLIFSLCGRVFFFVFVLATKHLYHIELPVLFPQCRCDTKLTKTVIQYILH